jgi:hypothetical protein
LKRPRRIYFKIITLVEGKSLPGDDDRLFSVPSGVFRHHLGVRGDVLQSIGWISLGSNLRIKLKKVQFKIVNTNKSTIVVNGPVTKTKGFGCESKRLYTKV